MTTTDQEKTKDILALATDQEMVQMCEQIAYNWEVACQRMEQLSAERDERLYDDDGTDALGVFNRLERVGSLMFSVANRPQSKLLSAFHSQIQKMTDDHRMDREIVAMLAQRAQEFSVEVPTLWKRLKDLYQAGRSKRDEDNAYVRSLYQKNYIPNMEQEEAFKTMKMLVEPSADDEEQLLAQTELVERLACLGEDIGKVSSGLKTEMALGLMIIQMAVKLLVDSTDLSQMEDSRVDALFEEAKEELLGSDAWREYWRSHLAHLSLLAAGGSLQDQLQQDADEVEQRLLALPGYIYNRWDESADAFGRALKESAMSDDQMLHLLFYLVKKQALESEGDLPESRLEGMRKSVKELAEKLGTLCSEKYVKHYEDIWDDIVQNAIIGSQLASFRNGKHNKGFNMQCFCHIVGWLMREKHFFDTNSPAELGKKLGDTYSHETFRDYIKKTNIVLTAQSVSELQSILAHYEKT